MGRPPLIVIPARFSASASALRFEAVVAARKLVEAVHAAGGEPLVVFPAGGDVRSRLWMADGVLLPGGGDLDPARYGGPEHREQYDVDPLQDAFDLAVARVALEDGLPLLAICRGAQVVNVALGGDLVQDLPGHRHVVHEVAFDGAPLHVSCYHHQAIGRLGTGLRVAARAEDGTIEAVTLPEHPGWFLGVQWHPEDTAGTDPAQSSLFEHLVRAASSKMFMGH